jgi:hypothetical protein
MMTFAQIHFPGAREITLSSLVLRVRSFAARAWP